MTGVQTCALPISSARFRFIYSDVADIFGDVAFRSRLYRGRCTNLLEPDEFQACEEPEGQDQAVIADRRQGAELLQFQIVWKTQGFVRCHGVISLAMATRNSGTVADKNVLVVLRLPLGRS